MEYLYVCHFSNGHIKVGRSVHPQSRIASHADRVACMGVELIEHHIVECVGHSAPAEYALIERCAELATKRNKSEWFEGLDFLGVCNLATAVASEVFLSSFDNPDVKKKIIADTLSKKLNAEEKQAICSKLGFGKGFLSQILTGSKQVSPRLCVAIESASRGEVTRQELRPKDWILIWPELAEKAAA